MALLVEALFASNEFLILSSFDLWLQPTKDVDDGEPDYSRLECPGMFVYFGDEDKTWGPLVDCAIKIIWLKFQKAGVTEKMIRHMFTK